MAWDEPFRQRWPEPVDDVRGRFGILVPSFSLRDIAEMTVLFLLVMGVVVLVLEMFV